MPHFFLIDQTKPLDEQEMNVRLKNCRKEADCLII